jgi:hypothetical protein
LKVNPNSFPTRLEYEDNGPLVSLCQHSELVFVKNVMGGSSRLFLPGKCFFGPTFEGIWMELFQYEFLFIA